MRVICITHEWFMNGGVRVYNNMPEYGDPYNVIGETKSGGIEYYCLAEYGMDYEFEKKSFIPADEPEAAVDAVNEILEQVTV